jgi:membrane dipeptidase
MRIAELDGALDGDEVELTGWMAPFAREGAQRSFALVEEASCCFGCLPREPARRVLVELGRAVSITGARLRVRGVLRVAAGDWRYRLEQAQLVGQPAGVFTRRAAIAASLLACVAVPAAAEEVSEAMARAAIAGSATVDIHTHAGRINSARRIEDRAAFPPVAEPMRQGGMAVLCLAVVPDGPVHKLMPDHHIHPFRDPQPGELYDFSNLAFQRVHDLIGLQGLQLVTDVASFAACSGARPGVIVSSEGGDFLEGRIARVAEAHDRWQLRHLQLTHYRVNELGDIQTEAPVHGGLTDFGADVIRDCNRLGIVVDVAHGTFDLVKRAVDVTHKPLVLSHTSLSRAPGPRSRTISVEHAKLVAGTGGVIGIWPPSSVFADKAALAAGMARMVDAVGIDHVGLGTDMNGLVGASSFAGYDELPALAQALLQHGFQAAEVRKLLGGNYARVFAASLA